MLADIVLASLSDGYKNLIIRAQVVKYGSNLHHAVIILNKFIMNSFFAYNHGRMKKTIQERDQILEVIEFEQHGEIAIMNELINALLLSSEQMYQTLQENESRLIEWASNLQCWYVISYIRNVLCLLHWEQGDSEKSLFSVRTKS